MTEDEARQVELVRAIEEEDRDAALLTHEDLAQAEVHARTSGGPKQDWRDGTPTSPAVLRSRPFALLPAILASPRFSRRAAGRAGSARRFRRSR